MSGLGHRELHESLRTRERLQLGALPDHLSGNLDKQQARAWIRDQIAYRVEEKIADEIRHGQRVVIVHADEAGLAAAMRYIRTVTSPDMARVFVGSGSDEERIRPGDQSGHGRGQYLTDFFAHGHR